MEEDDRGQGLAGPAENLPECPAVEDDREEDDGFSFPVPPLDTDACIVPVYPVFGRPPFPQAAPAPAGEEEEADEPETATLRVPLGRLLLEERELRARQQQDGRSVSARHRQEEDDDADEELEGVPPETYCLWAPGGGASSAPASPRPRCRKSGSTGSVLRWRRISDRLVGRSHSDGKEKFVFLDAPGALHPPPTGNKPDELEGSGASKGDAAAAGGVGRPLMYYGRGGGGAGGSGRRRSYLPYKQELVGLFANVSGLRRSYHPF
ncbi:hypothetical protein PR202_ga10239 [Eleusine coracana subsp. coracana]|uniref:DUF1645 family protein n=1 Tax=Eleusine coracana subsp. coracana TaxID=191504 RepID=A0AAV5C672_ELECO|nr:hypothetical protein QOZ80_1AG0027470 [Eleusine coracana subsp. coracana]GJM93660.1 hypothetical protein PR202_ga10239 [Eleusine coracana subsp. coracana]